jgi:hypothetical protein
MVEQADIRDKMEELDPEKLQQFAIAGTPADFDEALASGKIPKSGYLITFTRAPALCL